MAFMLNTQVSMHDDKVCLPRTWGQMADGLGLIYFGDLNIKVTHIALKNWQKEP